MKVSWSPLAMEKLGHAADFIALDNPNTAEKWLNDLFDKTNLLSHQLKMDDSYQNYKKQTSVNSSSATIVSFT